MASYATPTDLTKYSVSPAAFGSITDTDKQAQLDAASSLGEGYLADQFKLPISAPYPADLKMNVCSIAAFYLMTARGYKPGGADELIRQRYDDALKWFRDIATGIVTPYGIIDSTPNARDGGPQVVSGVLGNVVGGTATPTNTFGTKAYPFTGTVPGRRGW